MQSLTVQLPTHRDELLQSSREYALLRVMQMQGKGTLSREIVSKYAPKETADAIQDLLQKGDITFKEFAAAFAKPGEEAPGEGNATGMVAHDESGIMKKEKFIRREPHENDVVLQITYCVTQ
eukprot:jgi/Ulvmu1/3834/UM018_0046.1